GSKYRFAAGLRERLVKSGPVALRWQGYRIWPGLNICTGDSMPYKKELLGQSTSIFVKVIFHILAGAADGACDGDAQVQSDPAISHRSQPVPQNGRF
ncbi:MAG TPA: hypothetical protein VN939_22145, partial [Chthoniobacterales bacterium]|nr:hypothetical protein [Chthoniobacterales bacterium]